MFNNLDYMKLRFLANQVEESYKPYLSLKVCFVIFTAYFKKFENFKRNLPLQMIRDQIQWLDILRKNVKFLFSFILI